MSEVVIFECNGKEVDRKDYDQITSCDIFKLLVWKIQDYDITRIYSSDGRIWYVRLKLKTDGLECIN